MQDKQFVYLGMSLQLAAIDEVNQTYFAHCARHDFHLQACNAA